MFAWFLYALWLAGNRARGAPLLDSNLIEPDLLPHLCGLRDAGGVFLVAMSAHMLPSPLLDFTARHAPFTSAVLLMAPNRTLHTRPTRASHESKALPDSCSLALYARNVQGTERFGRETIPARSQPGMCRLGDMSLDRSPARSVCRLLLRAPTQFDGPTHPGPEGGDAEPIILGSVRTRPVRSAVAPRRSRRRARCRIFWSARPAAASRGRSGRAGGRAQHGSGPAGGREGEAVSTARARTAWRGETYIHTHTPVPSTKPAVSRRSPDVDPCCSRTHSNQPGLSPSLKSPLSVPRGAHSYRANQCRLATSPTHPRI
jgi:hypothetical protein